MDSNKDEALRSMEMAKDALKSGDKQRALRFLRIARRLDPYIVVEDLLVACDAIRSAAGPVPNGVRSDSSPVRAWGKHHHTEESVRLVREIRKNRDYYEILGLERSCSAEEIRKAYRRLSLKIHPDKNSAPGSEEAFKLVCEAFKCLSNEESRSKYNWGGSAMELHSKRSSTNVTTTRRRRKRQGVDCMYEDLDRDELFRSFVFEPGCNVHQTQHGYNSRNTRSASWAEQMEAEEEGDEFSFGSLLLLLPFLVMILILYLPFQELDYALQENYTFKVPKVVEKYGVEYYVKSPDFDQDFPPGSTARWNLEYKVVKDYKSMLGRYCHVEMQRRQWVRDYPMPHCEKLSALGLA